MKKNGFTLIEILIYTALIGIAGVFLNSTLISVLRLQGQQDSSTEVNQQINFVLQNVQKSVRDSSLIDMTSNVASSTLTLRMQDPVLDPTLIYLSGTTVYIKKGTATPLALTTSSVNADQLQFTRVSSYPGHDSVSVTISFSYNTTNTQKSFTKTITSAVARVSGATFDSDILPGIDATYNVGTTPNRWLDLNLSRNLVVGGTGSFIGNLGVGTNAGSMGLQVMTDSLCATNSNAWGSCYQGYFTGNVSGHRAEIRLSDNITSNAYLSFLPSATPATRHLSLSAGNSEADLIISGNGNVGIGTTTPASKLEVVGTGVNTYPLRVNTGFAAATAGYSGLKIITNDVTNTMEGDIYIRGAAAAAGRYLTIEAYDTTAAAYSNVALAPGGGNVGVGTTTPTSKLEVNGLIYSGASGFKFPDGTIQTTAGGGSTVHVPTRQIFLTGSGTYTTPAGVGQIKVTMVGGGSGGSGSGLSGTTGNGGAGGDTTFGTSLLVANHGVIGYQGGAGVGGSYSLGSVPGVGIAGGNGTGGGYNGSSGVYLQGGNGGPSVFGGAGGGGPYGAAGLTASPNSGSGGGGGATNSTSYTFSGSGGGAGGYLEAIIINPSASYSYSVGTAGGGGAAGTSGLAGGGGSSGIVIVDEYYTTAMTAANQWTTTGSDIYYNTGNVGIGTASPQTPLQIGATSTFDTNSGCNIIGGNLYLNAAGTAWNLINPASAGSTLQLCNDGTFAIRNATAGTNPRTNSYVMYGLANGNIGIGITNPGDPLTIQGNDYPNPSGIRIGGAGYASGGYTRLTTMDAIDGTVSSYYQQFKLIIKDMQNTAVDAIKINSSSGSVSGIVSFAAWTYNSDRRLKENILPLIGGLDAILALQPKHFDYINGAKDQLGFIAQDVQQVIPQAVEVADRKTGMLGLKTEFITPYLVKGMQEQQQQIDDLKAEVADLKSLISK